MGKFQNFLLNHLLPFILGVALAFFGGGYVNCLLKGKPRATPQEEAEWSRMRCELNLFKSYEQQLEDWERNPEFKPEFDSELAEKRWDRFLSNDKAEQRRLVMEEQEEHLREIDELVRKINQFGIERRGGYGKVDSDYDALYTEWIKDPMEYRINHMTFWDKVLYGWRLHKYFKK